MWIDETDDVDKSVNDKFKHWYILAWVWKISKKNILACKNQTYRVILFIVSSLICLRITSGSENTPCKCWLERLTERSCLRDLLISNLTRSPRTVGKRESRLFWPVYTGQVTVPWMEVKYSISPSLFLSLSEEGAPTWFSKVPFSSKNLAQSICFSLQPSLLHRCRLYSLLSR